MKLSDWLYKQMNNKNMGVRETARAVGVSHPLISDILNGLEPSYKTCVKLAEYYKVPVEQITIMAGITPPADNLLDRAIMHLYSQLSPNGKQQAEDFLQYLLQREERTKKG